MGAFTCFRRKKKNQ